MGRARATMAQVGQGQARAWHIALGTLKGEHNDDNMRLSAWHDTRMMADEHATLRAWRVQSHKSARGKGGWAMCEECSEGVWCVAQEGRNEGWCECMVHVGHLHVEARERSAHYIIKLWSAQHHRITFNQYFWRQSSKSAYRNRVYIGGRIVCLQKSCL